MDVEKLSVDGFNLNVSDAKARDMISDKYDPDNGTYVVGDTCINDDILYICNTDIDTPEDFDSSKWDADTVGHYCSELKSNLSQLDGLTVYKNLTPQTSYADFDDGSTLPLISLTSNIEPTQAGSGDPSPTNIRPISGHTEVNVYDVGDNWGDCADIPEPLTANKWYTVNLPYNTYTISFDVVNVVRTALGDTFVLAVYDGTTNMNILASKLYSVEDGSTYQSKGANISGRFYFTYTGKIKSLGYFWRSNSYQLLSSGSLENIMIEKGDNPTKQYTPYNGQTYKVEFKDGDNPLTVYGGTLDVVSGELKVVPYYASYNGETLEGEWISDRDVYAVGTTPTIGAQVVNIGATPQTYQLTPTQVNSLLGHNNIFSDTGNITNVKYLGILNLS